MPYQLLILPRAQKELATLPKTEYEKIKAKIFELASNPRPVQSKKLLGRAGWRIRIGNYRVIYEINDKERKVIILDVGDRKNIYQ